MSSQPYSQCIPFAHIDQLREGRAIVLQEADALRKVSEHLDTRFCVAVHMLLECRGSVVVTGIGKAGIIAQKVAATLSSTGTRAHFLHPAEAVHGDLGSLDFDDLVLALSNSGETEEICRLLPILARMEIPVVAITSRNASTLGVAAEVALELGNISEAGHFELAPTASTTAMLAIGDALALVVSKAKGFTRRHFAGFHPGGSLGQKLKTITETMRRGDELRIACHTATIREVLVSLSGSDRRTGAVILVDEEGHLSGLFTDSDLAKLLEKRADHQLDRAISEVMTSCPLTVQQDALLTTAVHMLSDHHISELPVIDEQGKPVGLIDITDVIGLMPEEIL